MVSCAEAHHRLSLRLRAAPQFTIYLNLVKRALPPTQLQLFSSELCKWVKSSISPGWTSYSIPSLCRMAMILQRYPKLLYGLNVLLGAHQRIECSVHFPEINSFVLIEKSAAFMYSISTAGCRVLFSDSDVRQQVLDDDAWARFLQIESNPQWRMCVAQILQVILDDPQTYALCRRSTYLRLETLAKQAVLPPEAFIRSLNWLDEASHERGPLRDQGGYTYVYEGNVDGNPACFRVLRASGHTRRDRKRIYQEFCCEAFVWRQLNHLNILPLVGVNVDAGPHELCFVSPWCRNGNIIHYLELNPDHDRFLAVCEIVEGIAYLHGLDPPVAHRDIKGANILVGDDRICRLADFGLSSAVESRQSQACSPLPAVQGSWFWMAPEKILPVPDHPRNDLSCDIYSLACTIYEIYTASPPFYSLSVGRALGFILNGQRPTRPSSDNRAVEEDIWWLVVLCWKHQPAHRPTIGLVRHYLQDVASPKQIP